MLGNALSFLDSMVLVVILFFFIKNNLSSNKLFFEHKSNVKSFVNTSNTFDDFFSLISSLIISVLSQLSLNDLVFNV